MLRKLAVASAAIGLALGAVQADHHGMGGDPAGPEVVLGAPQGFVPPPGMFPPEMTGDPVTDEQMLVAHVYGLIDADGNGAIDLYEFGAWVREVRVPPPPESADMADPTATMDGILRAGEGDLGGLRMAPGCSDELQDGEQLPQAENVPCGDREGNLVYRTICNMPGYGSGAISLPEGRSAACFGVEALRGAIGFEIATENGMPIWDSTMDSDSYRDLSLDGPGIYDIRSTGGSTDGAVTIRYVDVVANP